MELKKKLIEVSKAIVYLQKDKTNKMQDYKYLSEAKIKETIKSKFEEQGIVFNYSVLNIREYELSNTKSGTKQFCTIANGEYHFIDVDSDSVISGTWFGSGSDTGDKGLYKAITGGIKYVLNTNFLIPTGDDPEKDNDDNGNPKTEPKVEPTEDMPKTKRNVGETDTHLKNRLLSLCGGNKTKAKAEFGRILNEEKPITEEDLSNEVETYLEQKLGGVEV